MIASIDLHRGIVKLWEAEGLNDLFKSYWRSSGNDFPVIHDQVASQGQPFPYCVFSQDPGSTTTRMTSSGPSGRMEQREIPFEFHIHARTLHSGETAKVLAARLAEEVMKLFGGHPTVIPKTPVLDHGSVLRVQYQSDNGMRDGDQEWTWYVRYRFLVDVPVAA